MLAAGVALFLTSCKTKEEARTLPPSTDKVAILQHPVADYDRWRPVFDADDAARQSFGLTTIGVGRGIENPNQVIMYFRMEDTARANVCMMRPELKPLMDSAGVTAAPTVEYVNVLRNDTANTDITDRVLVKHKVKDFDAWLKVYDNEGMETRKSHGIIDRAIARGMDDPNMVYIVFAISDWDKANARLGSEALKKTMSDAGVEGPPEAVKYKIEMMK